MDNNEEVLEEIEDVNENNSTDSKVDQMIDQAMGSTAINTPSVDNSQVNQVNNVSDTEPVEQVVSTDNGDTIEEANNEAEVVVPKKSKLPIIIILSVLLLLDIIALVIYLIGIDKVFGIVK